MTNSTKLEIGDTVKHKAQTDKRIEMVVTRINPCNTAHCEVVEMHNSIQVKTFEFLLTSLVKVEKNA